ncbi:unnamed protein product, partial [Symbiodinium sp. KB8]
MKQEEMSQTQQASAVALIWRKRLGKLISAVTGKSLTGINISSAKTMDDITMHLQSLMKSYMRQRTLEKKDLIKVYDDLLSTFRQDSQKELLKLSQKSEPKAPETPTPSSEQKPTPCSKRSRLLEPKQLFPESTRAEETPLDSEDDDDDDVFRDNYRGQKRQQPKPAEQLQLQDGIPSMPKVPEASLLALKDDAGPIALEDESPSDQEDATAEDKDQEQEQSREPPPEAVLDMPLQIEP